MICVTSHFPTNTGNISTSLYTINHRRRFTDPYQFELESRVQTILGPDPIQAAILVIYISRLKVKVQAGACQRFLSEHKRVDARIYRYINSIRDLIRFASRVSSV